MYETENEFVIKLDVAGVDPADIEVTLFGDSLTIKGEIKTEADSEGKDYIWRERRSGQFVRTLEMPQIADAANVTAEFESGILTLVVPKSEEAKPKSVQIKVN
jgi:HSP20 family protein